jgi:hypothetical protein
MHHEKARELATYTKLGLGRQHKSKRRREAVDAARLHRFIGGNGPDRPWIKVLLSDYVRTWREVAASMDWDRQGDAARDLLRPRLEGLVYDRLALQAERARTLEAGFLKTHGRGMTAKERAIFQQADTATMPVAADPGARAARARRTWVQDTVARIRARSESGPNRLQQIWASVVGPEAAMETSLEAVDAVRGIAWCHSLSSVQSHVIRRRPGLAEKLSAQLGVKITKVLFR